MPQLPKSVLPRWSALLVALVLASCSQAVSSRVGSVMPVDVEVGCTPGGEVSFLLRPWTITIFENDTLQWNLTPRGGAQITGFTIEPQGGFWSTPWPFKNKRPDRVSDQIPARYSRMKGKPFGHYRYAVVLTCQNGAQVHRVVIDPDVVVDRARN